MGIAVDSTTRLSTVVNNGPSTDVYDPQPLDSVYRRLPSTLSLPSTTSTTVYLVDGRRFSPLEPVGPGGPPFSGNPRASL